MSKLRRSGFYIANGWYLEEEICNQERNTGGILHCIIQAYMIKLS